MHYCLSDQMLKFRAFLLQFSPSIQAPQAEKVFLKQHIETFAYSSSHFAAEFSALEEYLTHMEIILVTTKDRPSMMALDSYRKLLLNLPIEIILHGELPPIIDHSCTDHPRVFTHLPEDSDHSYSIEGFQRELVLFDKMMNEDFPPEQGNTLSLSSLFAFYGLMANTIDFMNESQVCNSFKNHMRHFLLLHNAQIHIFLEFFAYKNQEALFPHLIRVLTFFTRFFYIPLTVFPQPLLDHQHNRLPKIAKMIHASVDCPYFWMAYKNISYTDARTTDEDACDMSSPPPVADIMAKTSVESYALFIALVDSKLPQYALTYGLRGLATMMPTTMPYFIQTQPIKGTLENIISHILSSINQRSTPIHVQILKIQGCFYKNSTSYWHTPLEILTHLSQSFWLQNIELAQQRMDLCSVNPPHQLNKIIVSIVCWLHSIEYIATVCMHSCATPACHDESFLENFPLFNIEDCQNHKNDKNITKICINMLQQQLEHLLSFLKILYSDLKNNDSKFYLDLLRNDVHLLISIIHHCLRTLPENDINFYSSLLPLPSPKREK